MSKCSHVFFSFGLEQSVLDNQVTKIIWTDQIYSAFYDLELYEILVIKAFPGCPAKCSADGNWRLGGGEESNQPMLIDRESSCETPDSTCHIFFVLMCGHSYTIPVHAPINFYCTVILVQFPHTNFGIESTLIILYWNLWPLWWLRHTTPHFET